MLEEIRNLIVEVLGRDELDSGEVPVARDLGIIMVKMSSGKMKSVWENISILVKKIDLNSCNNVYLMEIRID